MKINFPNTRNRMGRVPAALFLLLIGFALTGCNVAPITATPSPLDFGSVLLGQSGALTLNVTFSYAIVGTYIAVDSGANTGDFQVVSQTCVGSTGTQSAVIRFKPTAAGTRSATLTIKGMVSSTMYTRTVALSGSTPPLSAGLAGAALQFDGATNYVTVAHHPALNAFPFTVEAWIKTTQATGNAALVNKYANGSFNGWQMSLRDGKISGSYFGDGANFVDDGGSGAFSSGMIADGNWHHVAFTVDVLGGKLYVDGNLKSTLVWMGTPTAATTSQNVAFGGLPGVSASAFAGQMDEVRLWNTARTAFQIYSNRKATQKENEKGLVAYYRFDEGKGTTTADAAPNHFNGTVTGLPLWLNSTAPVDTVNVVKGVARTFTLPGFDPNGRALVFAVASSPVYGTLSATSPAKTYTPKANYAGGDSFTYTASNGSSVSLPATVRIQTPVSGGRLLVGDFGDGLIAQFNLNAGGALSTFASGFPYPYAIINTPDGNLLVAAQNMALKLDGTTGASLGVFVTAGSGGLETAVDMAYGPDGNLYVVNETRRSYSTILRYDGATGAFMDTFIAQGSGGLQLATSLAFRPDGNLYVVDQFGNAVLRFNSATGAPLGVFASGNGLAAPRTLTFGPDNSLYVGNGFQNNIGSVVRFNGVTGSYIDTFVPNGNGGLRSTAGITFGNNGVLYVVSEDTRSVLSYDGITGAFLGVVGATNSTPYGILYRPALATVTGAVMLEGIASSASTQTVRFVFSVPGSPNTMISQAVGPSGAFSLQLPQGAGSLLIKGDKYLAARVPLDTTGGDVSGVTALLPAGDATNDNSVDSSDFGVLIGAFNTDSAVSGSGYDPTADFNSDGVIDSSDFALLIGNFNTVGDL